MLKIGLLLSVAVLAGCAQHQHRGYHEPIVDMQGVDPYEYELDLADCVDYARDVQVGRNTAEGAAGGAVVGAILGAVVGNHETAERGAGVGAVMGGVKANSRARHEQAMVVRNCLRGRGYSVLN